MPEIPVNGCCTGCRGTGVTADPETNGQCLDCHGTGCAHPEPLCTAQPCSHHRDDHEQAMTACPLGGTCERERTTGHPCDRDEHGDRLAACDQRLAFVARAEADAVLGPLMAEIRRDDAPCARKGCGRPQSEHEMGLFCP